jgi:hypothetical protein
MSHYDSTHPSEGDSEKTERAKLRLTRILHEKLVLEGIKSWIKEEVPLYLTTEPKPYHLDMGILIRNRKTGVYSFYGVEIDGKTHESKYSDYKDLSKDQAFKSICVPIWRIRLEVIIGAQSKSEKEIGEDFWEYINYPVTPIYSMKNTKLAEQLKENALARCRNKKCGHPAQQHNLAGCNFQQPNKAAMYCACTEPHFVSDM